MYLDNEKLKKLIDLVTDLKTLENYENRDDPLQNYQGDYNNLLTEICNKLEYKSFEEIRKFICENIENEILDLLKSII